jgi:hypothetical protein
MNRVINIFTFIVLIIFFLMVMTVVFDLSVSQFHLKGMKYKQEIFTAIAILVFLLGLIRIQRRYQGIKDMKRYAKFHFSIPVSTRHRNYGFVICLIEAVFMIAAIGACLLFINLEPAYVIPMMVVLSLLASESVIFGFALKRGGQAFRIGFDDSVIAAFDREMNLFYYEGLKKVDLHQNDLISFSYIDDLDLPLQTAIIDSHDRKAFRDALVEKLESKNIYVGDSLRNWQ